ncbi:AraC family transcriptional regulator [Clostridium grantii]|uniref:AraC-type DNA-binding protein n=1 Tax=Clostridium grantii DSM 8605 TaxID=1121316 RepID=A0A1M5U330_9CLOT|nr:helix-turn-helix domain-containing protein [Clostridium grantii]SHH57374.1 AraC-type DNA-binding protein [Clostridium grantii DSM 8605]
MTNMNENKQYYNSGYESSNFLYTVNRCGTGLVDEEFYICRDNLYPYCTIHFVAEGSGMLEYKGKEYNVINNQVFIIDAFSPHIYKTNSNDRFRLYWIEFSGSHSIDIIKSIIEDASPILSSPVSIKIMGYINRIMGLFSSDSEKNKYLISKIIYSMLINTFKYYRNSTIEVFSDMEKNCLKKVLDYIEMNIGEALRVHELAELANYSPDYFSKVFKKVVGESPGKHINNRRIIRAKELLVKTDMHIEGIAENLGFCDTSHFINRFKKAEGLTPAEFRKQSEIYSVDSIQNYKEYRL